MESSKNRSRFSPETLISAQRNSAPEPNASGSHAFYSVSKYSIQNDKQTNEIYMLDIEENQPKLFSDSDLIQELQWIDTGDHLLWTQVVDDCKTEIWIGSASDKGSAYVAGIIPAEIEQVRTEVLKTGNIAIAFSGFVGEDGLIVNENSSPPTASSVREYETIRVRFWDKYLERSRSTLWYTALVLQPDGRFKLKDAPLVNALKNTGMEFPWTTSPFEATEFDISQTGLLFCTVGAEVNPADFVTNDIYYIPLESFEESPAPPAQKISVPGWTGNSESAAFSPDGSMAAFLKYENWEYEGSNRRIFLSRLDGTASSAQMIMFADETASSEYAWDRSPSSLLWSHNSRTLYVTAEDHGKIRLFALPLDIEAQIPTLSSPEPLTTRGSVTDISRLGTSNKLLVTLTSMVDSSFCIVLDTNSKESGTKLLWTMEPSLGLKRSQMFDFECQGVGDYKVHSMGMKPSFYEDGKAYPVAFLIHGGPDDAWRDFWSWRWNAAVFAEQGYIVIMPNITGSTGYGQEFTNAVNGDSGGRTYKDMENVFEYVEKSLPFADCDRAVCLGASFGGYMVNWIAGQPLAKKFKCLVCHNGIFSWVGMMGSDVAASERASQGAALWEDLSKWDDSNPSRHTHNWTQPMMIIHSDKDYRVPITHGLAAFNVCQQRGIPSRFVNFPDEHHLVLKRGNSLQWHFNVLGWINKWAGVSGGVVLNAPISEPER